MKKRVVSMVVMFSLVLSMALSIAASNTDVSAKNRWGGDDMDDWPLSISCDPNFPLFGPEVGETRQENVGGLQYDKGNRVKTFKIKNYSPKIVKISKKKKNCKWGGCEFYVKGKKKGYAHIKITVTLKYAQDGKKKYVWNIKKYPVGHNDD